jgi:hypothetical protein
MLPYNHLYLIQDDFVYTRLQGLIWAGDGLLLNSKFYTGANHIFLDIAKNIKPELPLIVNCKRVTNFDESVYRIIKETNLTRKIIFTHIDEGFHGQFANELDAIFNGLAQQNKAKHLISTNHSTFNFSLQQYEERCKKVEEFLEKKYREIVKSCFSYYKETDHNHLEQLPSTAIYATGEFDAGKIISNPENFHWLTLGLSDIVESFVKKINEEYHDEIVCRLISVSLRASPFAAAISLLSNPEIKFDTVDHLGPKHKLFDIEFFDKLKSNIKEKIRYIYFGDFIIGGTELKIAQTYSQIYGYDLKHAVLIGSYFEEERYSPSVEVKAFVNLKKIDIPELKLVLEK